MTEERVVWALALGAALAWLGLVCWFVLRVWPRSLVGKLLAGLTTSGVALVVLAAVTHPRAFGFVLYALLGPLLWDPDASFYRSEFEEVSGRSFPESGVFVQTYSSAPDFRGEYEACGVFSVSPADFERLEAALPDEGHALSFSRWHGTAACDQLLVSASQGTSAPLRSEHLHPESDVYLDWGVLSDGKSVAFLHFTH